MDGRLPPRYRLLVWSAALACFAAVGVVSGLARAPEPGGTGGAPLVAVGLVATGLVVGAASAATFLALVQRSRHPAPRG